MTVWNGKTHPNRFPDIKRMVAGELKNGDSRHGRALGEEEKPKGE